MAAEADAEPISVAKPLYAKATEVIQQTLQISAEVLHSPVTPEKISKLLESTNILVRSIAEVVAQNPQALSRDLVSLMAEVLENVQMTVLSAGYKVRITEQGPAQSQTFQQKMHEFTAQGDSLRAAALDGMNLTQQVAAGGKDVHVTRGKLITTYNAYSHIRDENNSRQPFTREQLEEQAEILVVMQTALLSTGKSFAIEMVPEIKQEKITDSVTGFDISSKLEKVFFATRNNQQHQVSWKDVESAVVQEVAGVFRVTLDTDAGAHVELDFTQEKWLQVEHEIKRAKYGQGLTTVIRIEQGSVPESVRLNDMEFSKQAIEQAFATAQSSHNYFTCQVQYPDQLGGFPVKLRLYITDAWKINRLFSIGDLLEEKTPQTDQLRNKVHTQIAQIESPANPFIESTVQESILAQSIGPALERVAQKDDFLGKAYRLLGGSPEQRKSITSLINRMAHTVARDAGVTIPELCDQARSSDFDAIVSIALEVAHYTASFCRRLERDLSRLSQGDSDTALGLAQQLATTEFRKIENRLAFQTSILRTKNKKAVGQAEAPPVNEKWRQKGVQWAELTKQQKNGDPRLPDHQATAQKIELLTELCRSHNSIIKSVFSAIPMGQDYFYIKLNPVDVAQRKAYDARTAQVNDAQDIFTRQVAVKPEDVLRTPTGKLKSYFPALEAIGREVKVHLMPKTEDELVIVEQLLTLLSSEKGSAIRDSIGAIKVRLVGNNGNSQDRLPEVVIYTQDITANQVVALIQQEFSQMQGTGRTPRYNKEISNGLVYFAQSGGDLKDQLAQLGLLQKFFDKGGGFAQLRV